MQNDQDLPADYHHGDLWHACVDEGLMLLSEKGIDAVSLREVARRCRVSPRAPYQHFQNKAAFLTALSEVGFSHLCQDLKLALGRAGSRQGEARLLALTEAYIRFATTQPALMDLIFGDDLGRSGAARLPDTHAESVLLLVDEELAHLAPKAAKKERRLRAAAAWALVHGLADLVRAGCVEAQPSKLGTRALARTAIALLCRGISRSATATLKSQRSEPTVGGD